MIGLLLPGLFLCPDLLLVPQKMSILKINVKISE